MLVDIEESGRTIAADAITMTKVNNPTSHASNTPKNDRDGRHITK